jgi:hypothetical protein
MKIWRMGIACWVNRDLHTYTQNTKYVMLIGFHYKNDYMNAPQFYVIRTLPILFILTKSQRNNFVLWIDFSFEIHTFLDYFHLKLSLFFCSFILHLITYLLFMPVLLVLFLLKYCSTFLSAVCGS